MFFKHRVVVVNTTLSCGVHRTVPRRGGEASLRAPAPAAAVPEGLGYALGYRQPKMGFHESRQASRYMDDLRAVLELTVSLNGAAKVVV